MEQPHPDAVMLGVALAVAFVAAVRGMWSPCGLSMLSSLNPVSERARGHRFWLTGFWYVAGAVVGGAALGVGCGLAASALDRLHLSATPSWTIAAIAALVAVASDTAVFGRSLPDHPRQVDERWLTTYRRWIYAGGYGVQIGAGFATYIMTAAVYLTAALAILTASPVQAFGVCVAFGAVRGLTIVLAADARTPERLRAAHRRLDRLAAPSLWVAVGVEAAAAAVAGWQFGGAAAGAVALVVALGCVAVVRRPRAVVH